MYIYMYMYVYIYIYVYVYMCICICIYQWRAVAFRTGHAINIHNFQHYKINKIHAKIIVIAPHVQL